MNPDEKMNQIDVNIPEVPSSRYPIYIGSKTLGELPCLIEKDFAGLKPFTITDKNVYDAGHTKAFTGNPDAMFVIDPPGEVSKHIQTVTAIIETMEKAFLGRDTVVVAIGGGTVGDIAGFAAAVFKRGVPVVQVPTTTVSQADSAIGGKTGVDSTISKNAYGAFWQPGAVIIDVDTLKTLDDRQYRAGLVESVKHALIADEKYFAYIQDNIEGLLARDVDVLQSIADFNCRIKAAVVQEDPTEKNKRKILNYGHTIGHAAESVSGFELLHGEAVAIGIIAAVKIEIQLLNAEPSRLGTITGILEKLGVPVKMPADISKTGLFETMKRDKKAVAGVPRFVLLDRIGAARCANGKWSHEVSKEIVENAVDSLYK